LQYSRFKYVPQVAVYLHYLLHQCKNQLSQADKTNGKKMAKAIARVGHRVSSLHRRAAAATAAGEPPSPGALDDFQVQIAGLFGV